jgi:hypothetical protein
MEAQPMGAFVEVPETTDMQAVPQETKGRQEQAGKQNGVEGASRTLTRFVRAVQNMLAGSD